MAFTIGSTLDYRDLDAELNAAFDAIVTRIALSTEPVPTRSESVPQRAPVPTINVDLFRRALEHITDNPAEHDQRIWARRTETGIVGCLGYHAARLAGHTMDWTRSTGSERCWFCSHDHRNESAYVVADNAEGATHIFEAARTALGLNEYQANCLFRVGVTLNEQWRLAEQFTNGAIRRDNG
jgi:hypothetical protein